MTGKPSRAGLVTAAAETIAAADRTESAADLDAAAHALDAAVEAARTAVRRTMAGDPERPGRLSNLGAALQSRAEHGAGDPSEAARVTAGGRRPTAARLTTPAAVLVEPRQCPGYGR
jgi:hypothetical protein